MKSTGSNKKGSANNDPITIEAEKNMFRISNLVQSLQGKNMNWVVGVIAAVVAVASDMGLFMLTINVTNKKAKKKKVAKKEKSRDLQKRKVKRKIASRRKKRKSKE